MLNYQYPPQGSSWIMNILCQDENRVYLCNNGGGFTSINGAWSVKPAAFDFVVTDIFLFVKPQEHIKGSLELDQRRLFCTEDDVFCVWTITPKHHPSIVNT